MLLVPTSPCILATHALFQTGILLELIFVLTVLSPTVVVAESKAHPASLVPDSMLPVVVSGFSPLKTHFNSGYFHETRSQRTSPMVVLILPVGAPRYLSSTQTMDVMFLATSLIRLLYVLMLLPQGFSIELIAAI